MSTCTFIGETTYKRFNKTFNSNEDFEKYKSENSDVRVYSKSYGTDGKVYTILNQTKKYVYSGSVGEFIKGGKVNFNGNEYTMIDIGVEGPRTNRQIIWLD
ncbi:hypothetical protein ACA30_15755 [Virgibacillus soli]|nr:hypothetical protein ACA30_15755 [Virgibacillus soli]